jgi:hypothetical protein
MRCSSSLQSAPRHARGDQRHGRGQQREHAEGDQEEALRGGLAALDEGEVLGEAAT